MLKPLGVFGFPLLVHFMVLGAWHHFKCDLSVGISETKKHHKGLGVVVELTAGLVKEVLVHEPDFPEKSWDFGWDGGIFDFKVILLTGVIGYLDMDSEDIELDFWIEVHFHFPHRCAQFALFYHGFYITLRS